MWFTKVLGNRANEVIKLTGTNDLFCLSEEELRVTLYLQEAYTDQGFNEMSVKLSALEYDSRTESSE